MDLPSPIISLSIVSHKQSHLVKQLLQDLDRLYDGCFEVILTINIPESGCDFSAFCFISHIINNQVPKGFGANHNAAFELSEGAFFIVVNPDIRLPNFTFGPILDVMHRIKVAACAPLVLSNSGSVEDSARVFPTIPRLLGRVLLRQRKPDYQWGSSPITVDWLAGMFVAFRRAAFAKVGGFDEKYFMYCEDIDICKRIRNQGWEIVLQPSTSVIHDAQRASGKSLKYLRWHLRSMFRFLFGF